MSNLYSHCFVKLGSLTSIFKDLWAVILRKQVPSRILQKNTGLCITTLLVCNAVDSLIHSQEWLCLKRKGLSKSKWVTLENFSGVCTIYLKTTKIQIVTFTGPMMVVQDAYTDFWPVAHMAGGHICLCHVATTMLGIFVDCVFCGSEVAIKGHAMCEWSDWHLGCYGDMPTYLFRKCSMYL